MAQALGGLALANAHIGPRLDLEHEGEVLATHAGRHVAHHLVFADQARGHIGGKLRLGHGVDGGRVHTLVMHFGRGPKALGNALAQMGQALLDVGLYAGAVSAHRAHQGDLAGDDAHRPGVAALHRANAEHGLVHGREVARHDALGGGDDVPGHQHRVHGLVGPRAMPALAGDGDLEPVHRRLHGARGDANHAQRHIGGVVLGVHLRAREAIEQAIFDHRAGTGVALFAGLKNQTRGAAKLTRLNQITRRTHQHGGVAVVPASVHQAGRGRLPDHVVVLVQGQRVHVGTQADHARGAFRRTRMGLAVDQRHHAGFAQARVHLVNAAQAQCLLHPRRGVDLFKT